MGFFGELLSGLAGGFNEVMQCTNFTQSIINAGNMDGMDEEVKNRIILDALKNCGAADTPDTLLGEIYPILEKKAAENSANLSQPTAHSTCPAKCSKDRSKCGECLSERLAIMDALNYAENPALYQQIAGAQPSAAESGFVPSSALPPEQQAYELIYKHQLKTVDEMSAPEQRKVMINMNCAGAWGANPTLSKPELKMLAEQSVNEVLTLLKAKMSLSDLYFVADYHHMSVPAYLRGLYEGDPNLKTAAVLRKEQQVDRESEIRRQQMERDRQLQEEKRERQRQLEQEKHRIQMERIKNNPPNYGGGYTSRTCADCTYYSPGAGKCAYKDIKINAGDSCGFFKWK